MNATLFVNPWQSRCGKCGNNCDPHEETHDTTLTWNLHDGKLPGCGVRWTHVSTNYTNFEGLYDSIKKMRPDLEFIYPGSPS